jgi:hypothetical protein
MFEHWYKYQSGIPEYVSNKVIVPEDVYSAAKAAWGARAALTRNKKNVVGFKDALINSGLSSGDAARIVNSLLKGEIINCGEKIIAACKAVGIRPIKTEILKFFREER